MKHQVLRIAMIGCKGIPAAEALGGGIETHVEELSARLAARGHQVTVYARPYANPQRLTSWKGVRIITLPTIRRKNLDAITHTFLASCHVLFQRADIIHYHAVGPSTLAWIPRVFNWRSKVVVTFHSRDRFHEKWGTFARAYLAFGEWTAVTYPHATIIVSHVLQLFAKRMYGATRLTYIPSGVDIPKPHPGSNLLPRFNLTSGNYFFTLSRLMPLKAIEDAIEAFYGVVTTMRLAIIGAATMNDDVYHQKLQKLASRDSRVQLLGHQSARELDQLIANEYAMIHPSRIEGLSIAILEAMSHGKLVIMSDIPENRELVDHSGIAYKVGDVHALRETLQWVVSDPKLVEERGRRAREVIERLYSWNSVVERVEALYQSLLARDRSSP